MRAVIFQGGLHQCPSEKGAKASRLLASTSRSLVTSRLTLPANAGLLRLLPPKTPVRETHRRREGDSNRRSLPKKRRFSEQHPLYLSPCGSTIGTTNAPSARAATACVAGSGRGRRPRRASEGRAGGSANFQARRRSGRCGRTGQARLLLSGGPRRACKGLSGRALASSGSLPTQGAVALEGRQDRVAAARTQQRQDEMPRPMSASLSAVMLSIGVHATRTHRFPDELAGHVGAEAFPCWSDKAPRSMAWTRLPHHGKLPTSVRVGK